PEGRFSIPELTSGMPLTVTVEAEGYEPARLLRVVARPENEAPLTKITITKPGSIDFATLSGTVVDHEGNPSSGVQLRLIASAEITIKLTKPATVRFSFDPADYPTAVGARLSHTAVQAFLSFQMNLPKEKSEFSFAKLPPGEYWLSLNGPSERHATQPQMFT